MFCRNCGKDIGDSRFCTYCGYDTDTTRYDFCMNCGAKAEGMRFCPECGFENNVRGLQSKQYHKTVNKIAFALIAIFLGGLGIHRFYAGKIVSGVVYLLFSWTGIPSILGLVEGIVALTRDDDGKGNIVVYEDKYFV